MSTWDEIRTAFHVARAGTVSGAAEELGVHHATVIRHIDALEDRLGVKLFQRHPRGYSSTEAGQDLLQVAQATDDQFAQLVNRIRGRGDEVTGELVVTSLAFVSPRLTPTLARFQERYPDVVVRFLTGEEVLRLEYGEAHVAIRAGAKPDNPDNVVQPFVPLRVSFYASQDYIERKGRPETADGMDGHTFVGLDNFKSRAPSMRWLVDRVPTDSIIFRGSDNRVLRDAIVEGVGIGALTCWEAERHPNLVRLFDPRPEWEAPLWLVTHVDLHRTTKVQAFLSFLKEEAKSW
ncbi:MAG: LysR family transcriptional regulator [Silicimonas sp.]|nr:LysR family transcriptional regulator [Silicimonas sp.]